MKKLISLLLALVICLSLTTIAFAQQIYVAEVGGKPFYSVDAAIIAAKSGETVSLLNDCLDPVEISNIEDVTLDLNGRFVGNLSIIDSNIVILDSVKPARGTVLATEGESALKAQGSVVTVQNGKFISADGNAIEAENSMITVISGSFGGTISVEESALLIYSGYFSTPEIIPYINEKCSVSLNTDEESREDFPYVVSAPGGNQQSDIEELPIIGSIDTLLEGDYRCPACDRFEQFYSGENGNIISTFAPVKMLFQAIHAMIHTIYRVTGIFT